MKNKGSPELNQLSLTKVWSCLLTINELPPPPPAILDHLLSEVILRDLAWVPISYVFVYSKSLRPTYFRALIQKNSGPFHLQPSICPCQWLFLGEPQAIGLGPYLSHLIYIYKSKITKYMYMVQCPIHRSRNVVIHMIKGSMKVISGFLPETWGYSCMKNCISTTRNCHSHIHESTHFILFALVNVHPRFFFPRLVCGPLNSWAPGRRPGWPPSQWAWSWPRLPSPSIQSP